MASVGACRRLFPSVRSTSGGHRVLVVSLFTGHRSPVILPVIFVTTLECPHIVLIVDTLMSTMIERLRAYIRAAVVAAVAAMAAVAGYKTGKSR